jgi:hypothetical protein
MEHFLDMIYLSLHIIMSVVKFMYIASLQCIAVFVIVFLLYHFIHRHAQIVITALPLNTIISTFYFWPRYAFRKF